MIWTAMVSTSAASGVTAFVCSLERFLTKSQTIWRYRNLKRHSSSDRMGLSNSVSRLALCKTGTAIGRIRFLVLLTPNLLILVSKDLVMMFAAEKVVLYQLDTEELDRRHRNDADRQVLLVGFPRFPPWERMLWQSLDPKTVPLTFGSTS